MVAEVEGKFVVDWAGPYPQTFEPLQNLLGDAALEARELVVERHIRMFSTGESMFGEYRVALSKSIVGTLRKTSVATGAMSGTAGALTADRPLFHDRSLFQR